MGELLSDYSYKIVTHTLHPHTIPYIVLIDIRKDVYVFMHLKIKALLIF